MGNLDVNCQNYKNSSLAELLFFLATKKEKWLFYYSNHYEKGARTGCGVFKESRQKLKVGNTYNEVFSSLKLTFIIQAFWLAVFLPVLEVFNFFLHKFHIEEKKRIQFSLIETKKGGIKWIVNRI